MKRKDYETNKRMPRGGGEKTKHSKKSSDKNV